MLDLAFVEKILHSPDIRTKKGLRDSAILSALFGGGLRRSEVASLRVADVRHTSSGNTYLYLRSTKAKKDAEAAIPDWAAQRILEYQSIRLKDGAMEGDYLFVSYRGQAGNSPTNEPISHSGIYRLFKKYCMMAGVKGHLSPHSARATAITKLLADGVPHRLVQQFSRHSSVQMVEVYDKRRIGIDENPGVRLKYGNNRQ